jgi:iron complex transport system substrate-binding protein
MKRLLVLASILISLATYSKVYNRIISLAPSISENIYSLEAKDKLVGCTSYCEVAKNEKEVIGSIINLNTEKIISLNPDLVIATTMIKPELTEVLKKFDIEVVTLKSPKSYKGICEQYLRIASFVGKIQKAKEIISSINTKVYNVKLESKKHKQQKFFYQIGSKPLFTVLSNTFMDDYIQFFNGENIAKDMKHGTITREAVIASDPDVIFVCTMGLMGQDEVKIWENYSDLSAVKHKRVFIVNSSDACVPTPQRFLKTIEHMAESMKNRK